jgi:hypothetical protein
VLRATAVKPMCCRTVALDCDFADALNARGIPTSVTANGLQPRSETCWHALDVRCAADCDLLIAGMHRSFAWISMGPPLAGPYPVAFLSEAISKVGVKPLAQAGFGLRCRSRTQIALRAFHHAPEERSRILPSVIGGPAGSLGLHSMISLAVASSIGGTERPSALAVLRLMTSSNFLGCSTGKSAGFSPLRMRPT